MVDWGAGNYERTAAELEPVAELVVQQAALAPGDRVADLACGTGNAALLAAVRGARVVGVDAAPRLLEVARERARAHDLDVEFCAGDLLELPLDDGAFDIVVSVFGVIFASDPSRAVHEIARVLRPGGRALISAWIPAGPVDAMLAAMRDVVERVTLRSAPERFPWSDPAAVTILAREAGMSLQSTISAQLAIRHSSPEGYVTEGREHPMALAIEPELQQAGAQVEAQAAMTAVMREANEDPDAFLIHSPYVVHELRHELRTG